MISASRKNGQDGITTLLLVLVSCHVPFITFPNTRIWLWSYTVIKHSDYPLSILYNYFAWQRSRHSYWPRARGLRGRSSITVGLKNFHFSVWSRPALGPTQPPIQCVPRAISQGENYRAVVLTIHLQLVPMSSKREYIYPLPLSSSWSSA
jgi:hypothetical protein